ASNHRRKRIKKRPWRRGLTRVAAYYKRRRWRAETIHLNRVRACAAYRMPPVLRAIATIAALACLGLVIAGCDAQENADTTKGRMLFQQKCGVCHTLAQAGTSAQVGPNLDDAFSQIRAAGSDQDFIKGVVNMQIQHPEPAKPSEVDIYMPPNV